MLIKSKLRMFLLCVFWSQFAIPWQQFHAQNIASKSGKPIVTTVCELTRNGSEWNGKRVSVRAAVIDAVRHGILLVDPKNRCAHGLTMEASKKVSDNGDFRAFDHAIYVEGGEMGSYREKGEKRVTATFVGIVEYRPGEPRLKWVLQVEHISNIQVKPKEQADSPHP
jgi:hypothetical protein